MARVARIGEGVFVCRKVIGDGGFGDGVFRPLINASREGLSAEGEPGLSVKIGRADALPLVRRPVAD